MVKAALLAIGLALLAREASATPDLLLLGVGSAGGCAQSATFLARTSGENAGAITTFICGLVADGMIDSSASMASTGSNPYCGSGSVFDRLVLAAMANSTDALLDICGHASAVANGSPTFTAHQGWTGGAANNSTVYIDTGFNPSVGSPQYATNNAHLGTWILTNIQNTTGGGVTIGALDSTPNQTRIYPWQGDGTAYLHINENIGAVNGTVAGAHGNIIGVRTGASARAIYQNGTLIASDTGASTGVPNQDFYVLGNNNQGTMDQGDSNQVAMWHLGKAMTATQMSNLYSLGCTCITTINGSC